MIVEWKEVDVGGYKAASDMYGNKCSINHFTDSYTGEVIDVRHEQPGFFSKGKKKLNNQNIFGLKILTTRTD